MNLNSLTAISPVDGRYRRVTAPLAPFFSEYGLIRYRVLVEVEYFIALCSLPLPQLADFDSGKIPLLRKIYSEFNEEDALRVKEIEKVTNHDVKAVEYYLKEQFDRLGLGSAKEFIHFGLTSQDINNTAIPYSWKAAMEALHIPALTKFVELLRTLSAQWDEIAMLAKTHGQPASPTRLG